MARGGERCRQALPSPTQFQTTNYQLQITISLSRVLVRGTDEDEPPVGARDGSADEDEVVFRVDADDLQVANGDALGTVAARHAQALLGSAVATVAGVRAD